MSKAISALRQIGVALVGAARAMWSHEVPRDAGAIAYFSLFILFPAILVLFAVVYALLGLGDLRTPVVERIILLFPGSAPFLRKNLLEITRPSPALFLSCFIVVIWGSTWIFTFLENALNRAWDVPRRRTFWESRIRSIALLVLGGTMLLISAAITFVVNAMKTQAETLSPAFAKDQIIITFWKWPIWAAGIMIAIIVFLFVYKLMPDCHIRWSEALSGSIVATTLWEIDWEIFIKLVPVFDSQKVYGTTGFIIALLTWLYASSLITLYGANFSAKLHGARMRGESGRAATPVGGKPISRKIKTFSPRGTMMDP
jgi:membrane protein